MTAHPSPPTERLAPDTGGRRAWLAPGLVVFPVVSALLAVVAVAGVAIGSTAVAWEVVVRVIAANVLPTGWIDVGSLSDADQAIVWLIRTPRVIVAGLVGAALAVAGTQLQGVFRNPLAESSIIGVSQGAALGAVIAFITGWTAASALWLPLTAFVGAFLALFAVYSIASRSGRAPVATLLLAGIALGAMITACSSLLISLNFVDWQIAGEIVFWLMGGLDSRTWTHVLICAPFVALGLLVAFWYSRDLDLLLLGEESASALGVDVEPVRRAVLVAAALLTAAAVSVSGVVGFVGLVVPHALRLVLGPSHRRLLAASVVTGAAFVIACDLLARTANPPSEIRLGIVTAAFGAPFFLYLLRQRRKEIGYF